MKHDPLVAPAAALPPGWALYVAEAAPGQFPVGPRRPLAFASWLYLEPAYQALQTLPGAVLGVFLEDEAAGRTLAQLYVALDYPAPGEASSPARAPFGGVQAAPEVPAAALHALLAAAEQALRRHGQQRLHLRPPAPCYNPTELEQLAEVLARRGYEPVLTETNYHLDPARPYDAHLHPSERRRLRRCQQAGLVPEQEPLYLLPLAYEFIARCRQERGYDLSLSLSQLQAQARALPGQHLLFSVRRPGGEWAALTLAIQASPGVVYSFAPASPLAENSFSPVVLLTAGLHAYARASRLAAVDLGTSTLPPGQPNRQEGIANEPLLRFKRHLGGVATERVSWVRKL